MRSRIGAIFVLFLMLASAPVAVPPRAQAAASPSTAETAGASGQDIYFVALKLFQLRDYAAAREMLTRLLEEYPRSPLRESAAVLRADSGYYLARVKGKKHFMPVIDEYEAVMRNDPRSSLVPWVRLQIGRSYSGMGFYYEAAAVFQALIDDLPTSRYVPYALLGLARSYFSLERFPEAQVLFEKLSEQYPGTPPGIAGSYGIANAFYRLGEYARAEVFYRKAMKDYPQGAISSPETLFGMGETLYRRGKYAEARKIFFDLVNLHPTDALSSKGLARVGDCYRRLGQIAQSNRIYLETAERYPYEEGGYISRIRLADVEMQKSRKNRAILPPVGGVAPNPREDPLKSYREVIRAGPTPALSEVALIRLASAQSQRRQFHQAIETLETLLREYPYGILAPRARQMLRQTAEEEIAFYRGLGRNGAVVDIYQKMRRNVLDESADPKTIMQVGESFAALGLYGPAMEVYRDLLHRKKGAVPRERLLFLLGEARLSGGDRSGAAKVFSSLARGYPKSSLLPRALLRLGEIALDDKDPGRAYGFFKKSVRADPRFRGAALAFYHLGKISLDRAKYGNAAGFFARAVKSRTPTDGSDFDPVRASYFLLADSLFRLGRLKEALAGYATARRLYPHSPRAPWARLQMGIAYRDLGVPEKAESIFENLSARKANPFLARIASGFLSDLNWEAKSRPRVLQFLEARKEERP